MTDVAAKGGGGVRRALARRPVSLPSSGLADRVVVRLREAETALRRATTIHQAKLIADVAAAQGVLAQRQQLGDDIIGYAHAIRIEALARLGELLKQTPKASGGSHGGRPKKLGSKREPSSVAPPTLRELGVDKKTAAIAQQLAALDPPTRQAIASREASLTDVLRTRQGEARRSARLDTLAAIAVGNTRLPAAVRYPVTYADPPWRYEHVKTESRAIENQYPTMALDQICALPVADLTTDDALLFLWATSPKLGEAMRVVEAWGFTYRQGELQIDTFLSWIANGNGQVEVKRKRYLDLDFYVETHCDKGRTGQYAPSGLSVSTARMWAFVIGDTEVSVLIPVEELRAMLSDPSTRDREERDGQCPTKGKLVSLAVLLYRHRQRDAPTPMAHADQTAAATSTPVAITAAEIEW